MSIKNTILKSPLITLSSPIIEIEKCFLENSLEVIFETTSNSAIIKKIKLIFPAHPSITPPLFREQLILKKAK